jgi:hypothetical protein
MFMHGPVPSCQRLTSLVERVDGQPGDRLVIPGEQLLPFGPHGPGIGLVGPFERSFGDGAGIDLAHASVEVSQAERRRACPYIFRMGRYTSIAGMGGSGEMPDQFDGPWLLRGLSSVFRAEGIGRLGDTGSYSQVQYDPKGQHQ